MNNPQFSVIIPTLNEEKFVGNLLESLAQQTLKDFEVVVVDGGSKDKTVEVVRKYQNLLPSVRILTSHEKNTAAQRNLGAKNAAFDWLLFVDADTILQPYFFDRVSRYLDKHECSFCTTWCSPDSEIRGDAILSLFSNITVETSITLKRPIAPGPLTIVSRRAHESVNGYDKEYRNTEDVDYGRRLVEKGYPLHIIRESLYVWSLRRFRKEGTLKNLQRFAITALLVLFTKKPQKYISGYDLGGALYSLKKTSRLAFMKKYQQRLEKILKMLME
jgi:glycosyltransferase involved in cell wall biosynthesis